MLSASSGLGTTFVGTHFDSGNVPEGEQRAIVAHIATESVKLDQLRVATERTTALLKERRAALIAAAMTGQIDVQEAIP